MSIAPFPHSILPIAFANFVILLQLNNQLTNKPAQLLFPFQGFFPPHPSEIETNELLIWQYDLRNIFALSEKFLSYLKEEGKGLVLRMAGYWSQEVLNVRWDYALQEVEEVGGKGGGHQKHLHLHLKKGINSRTLLVKTQYQVKVMIDFLLLLIKNFTCSVYPAVHQLW